MNKQIEMINEMIKEIKQKTYLDGYSLFLEETNQHLPSPSRLMKSLSEVIYGKIDERILKIAAKKGHIIHSAIEESLESDMLLTPQDLEEKHMGHWKAFEKFYDENDLITYALELRTWNKDKNHSGIIDFVGSINGKNYIVDWKTTAKVNKDYVAIQLYFYKLALESFGIFIDDLMVVHLKKNGEYELVNIDKNMYPIYEKVCDSLLTIKDYKILIEK